MVGREGGDLSGGCTSAGAHFNPHASCDSLEAALGVGVEAGDLGLALSKEDRRPSEQGGTRQEVWGRGQCLREEARVTARKVIRGP